MVSLVFFVSFVSLKVWLFLSFEKPKKRYYIFKKKNKKVKKINKIFKKKGFYFFKLLFIFLCFLFLFLPCTYPYPELFPYPLYSVPCTRYPVSCTRYPVPGYEVCKKAFSPFFLYRVQGKGYVRSMQSPGKKEEDKV